jgi:hypothetical protein
MSEQTEVDANKDEKSFDDYFDEFAGISGADDELQVDEGLDGDNASDDQSQDDESLTPLDDKDKLLSSYQAEIEALRKEKEDLEHSFNSQKGRVSALQRKIDTEKQIDQGAEQSPPHLGFDSEELQQAIELFPEIVTPLLKAFEQEREKLHDEVRQQLAPIHQQDQQRYVEHQISVLDNKHPEWRNVVNSKEYHDWLANQHEAVQQLSGSMNAKDYEYLLSSFANTRSQKATDITQRRQQKLAANVSVQSRGPSKLNSAPDDFDSAWDYYANKKR